MFIEYRWTGTYFDEDDELDTSGARAVTAFQDNDAIIIVVAQNVPSRKVIMSPCQILLSYKTMVDRIFSSGVL